MVEWSDITIQGTHPAHHGRTVSSFANLEDAPRLDVTGVQRSFQPGHLSPAYGKQVDRKRRGFFQNNTASES